MDLQAVKNRARAEAQRVRKQYRVTTPVNPVRLAEQLGIRVVAGELERGTWGGILVREGEVPVIVVQESDHKNRHRFTIAHEIGHFVDHSTKAEPPKTYVDRRDIEAGLGSDPNEVFANQFAAELLMPLDEVREMREEGYSIGEMARHFGVSDMAMGVRVRSDGNRDNS